MSPYKYEYLVSPDAMNITDEIDIGERIHETVLNEDTGDVFKEASHYIELQTEKAKIEFQENTQPDWFTEERCIRNTVAKLKWRWYVQDNDFFIDDYKKVFGIRNGDVAVTTEKIDSCHLDELVDDLNDFPSDENLNAVTDYLEAVTYVR